MALTINELIGAHESYRSLKNKRLLNATQLLDKLTLEMSTLVCMKPLWYTIVGNKIVEAVWFLVGMARAYLVKWSVIISTFPTPLDGSRVR